jgi:small subunit ribosomal protein S7
LEERLKKQENKMADILAFNRWSTSGIVVADLGLKDYITLQPRIVPRTGAKYAGNRFHKSRVFIIERLINKLMVCGHKGKKHFRSSSHVTGKANNAYQIVEDVLELIEQKTNENPLAVFVKALENAAPREEIITIEYNTKKSIVNALADEIIAAYNSSNTSAAISKKLELERQADSSR